MSAFCEALAAGGLPASVWAAAPDAVVAEVSATCQRRGIGVDRVWFTRLEAPAAGFLVAEATLD